jgi:AcrR family transcriptional regulator
MKTMRSKAGTELEPTPERKPEAKRSKRDAILDAMLDVVVERGFHESPMSLIAERSGASAGVIYHHFDSKEAIIQAVYGRVRELKKASLLEGYSPELEAREAFLLVAGNAYRFYRQHIRELRFLDQYESAGFVCVPEDDAHLDERQREFERRFRSRSQGGVLANLPAPVIEEMTLGLVARLARQPQELSPEVLRVVSEKMWDAVKA